MARRGRKLTVEWSAADDAASLYARYRRERRADVRPRLHGLWLVRTGRTTREVAEVLGVDERTVQRWLAWYRAGGLAPLGGRHAGSQGAPSFLTAEQKHELAEEVATGRFRTAVEIRAWVQERWGVSYTAGGMYALLHRLRCAPKVPRPIHEKADHLAQARWKKDVLSQPFRRWDSEIGVMRGCWCGETGAAGRLPTAAWVGTLGWEGRASRRPEGCRLVFLLGEGPQVGGSGRGRSGCPGAIALMDGLVVALAGRQQVMQNLQPAVGEGADRLEVALAGGALRVVEGAGPGRARERAERPAQQRLAQESVAGAASDDHARAA